MVTVEGQAIVLMRRSWCLALSAAVLVPFAALVTSEPALAGTFAAFESGQVRPLALSPDGTRLFAVNTPDNRLEVFAITDTGIDHLGAVRVGLEPVAVSARSNTEVWVVNHLSDSVSVVDVSVMPPRLSRTLLVGDEPQDIVFGGPGRARAFVSAAHRGQNAPFDPQLSTPGIGRADVWVFDTAMAVDGLGGAPLTIITLFADSPRALAVSPDGATVYAAIFHSGNQTTTVPEAAVCDGGESAPPCEFLGRPVPGGLPGPNLSSDAVLGPETGLIVRLDPRSGLFEDELGRDWTNAVPFQLPDKDVFVIDATSTPPVETGSFSGVGTIIYNLAVNPASGAVYAANTEAANAVRLEPRVQGHLHEARISILQEGLTRTRRLNTHIDYATRPSPDGTRERSLAIPLGMAVSSDGTTLYVAAYGSGRVAVLSTADLEAGTFEPDAAAQVPVSGGGPSGVILDEPHGRLYVLTRFDNAISVIDVSTRTETLHMPLYNPEPVSIVTGRRFLYDARFTSSNGEAACASCHVFGDFDGLAWDLGDPNGAVVSNPNPVVKDADLMKDFHPLKGPMVTQTLRGLASHGSMHWRADRTGGNDVDGDPGDENAAFHKFNRAFVTLLGRTERLSDNEMQQFADFVLQILPPPNPIRALDNRLTDEQQAGREMFRAPRGDCSECHTLDPALGFFGTNGSIAAAASAPLTQYFKVPQLRNVYTKVGRFFLPGEQIRAYGFFHDGTISQDRSLDPAFPFIYAFDSNLAPVVGQQVTRNAANGPATDARIDLLLARGAVGECDLVATATVAGQPRGWLQAVEGSLQSDRRTEAFWDDQEVRALAAVSGQEVTYTCAPPGSGVRLALDRDEDTFFDGDELDAGSNPADPSSIPDLPTPPPTATSTVTPTPRATCAGDCNGNHEVTVEELILSVSIALGTAGDGECPPSDSDGDGLVSVDDIIRSVNVALSRCPT